MQVPTQPKHRHQGLGFMPYKFPRHPHKAGIHDTGAPGHPHSRSILNNTRHGAYPSSHPRVMIHLTTFRPLWEDYLYLPRLILEFLKNSEPWCRIPSPPWEQGRHCRLPSSRIMDEDEQHVCHAVSLSKRAQLMTNQSCIQECIKSEEPCPWTSVMAQAPPTIRWGVLALPDSDKSHLQPGCINHFLGVPAPFFHL